MEYSIQRLARLAGISARTLRYYDEIGLLPPLRVSAAGYRIYGPREVDLLQQILFYRELELPLAEIARIVQADDFDRRAALRSHLSALRARQARTAALIVGVEKTLSAIEGGIPMQDTEKFEAFKTRVIAENEQAYGAELRARYGDATIDAANDKLRALSPAAYAQFEALRDEIQAALEAAVRAGDDPAGETGRRIAALHKTWLCLSWPKYNADAHRALAEGYVTDARFTAYYDRNVSGCAAFLCRAVQAMPR